MMWIGTGDGLNCFDGRSFIKYRKNLPNSKGLENSVIRQVLEDPLGNVWVLTDLDLYRFHQKQGRFERILPASLGGMRVLHFERGKACIFIAQRGLLFYDIKTGALDSSRFLPTNAALGGYGFSSSLKKPGSLSKIYVSGEDGLWEISRQNGQAKKLYPGVVHAVLEHSGNLYFGVNDSLLCMSHKGLKGFRIPAGEHVFTIHSVDEHRLWLGTNSSLYEFDLRTEALRKLKLDNQSHQVKEIWKDHDGIVWIGTDGAGFGVYAPSANKFEHLSLQDKADEANSVYSVIESDQKIWSYVHGRGLVVADLKGEILKVIPGPDKLFGHIGNCLKLFDQQIFIGTRAGLYSVNKDYSFQKISPGTDTINDFFIHHNTVYTFGYGIKEYNFIRGRLELKECFRDDPYFRHPIKFVTAKSYPKIYGCNGSKFFCFDAESKKIEFFSSKQEFPKILSLHIKGGQFILSTYNGIYVYRQRPDLHNEGKHFLRGEVVYGIQEDAQGRYWCSSNSGIYLLDSGFRILHHFDMADGLQSMEFNSRSWFRNESGHLYFGGINGLNRIHEEDLKLNTKAPSIHLKRILISDQEVDSLDDKAELSLSHEENLLAAEITVPEYASPDKLRYSFFLEGWDKSWTEHSANPQIRYAGLRAATYKLFAKACNADGIWSEPVFLKQIKIHPAWWQSWWFRAAMLCLILASIIISVRQISRRKLRQKLAELEKKQMLEMERNRISRDMHDDLGAELTKINILSKKMLAGSETDPVLQNISDASTRIIGNMREIIWALNAGNDNVGITIAYLAEYASSYLEQKGIRVQLENRIIDEDLHLSAAVRRNLLLILKEALHNIAKHSGATEAQLKFELSSAVLSIELKDNGKGFSENGIRPFSNGLMNMRSRSEEINAILNLESAVGAGTNLRLSLKLDSLPAEAK